VIVTQLSQKFKFAFFTLNVFQIPKDFFFNPITKLAVVKPFFVRTDAAIGFRSVLPALPNIRIAKIEFSGFRFRQKIKRIGTNKSDFLFVREKGKDFFPEQGDDFRIPFNYRNTFYFGRRGDPKGIISGQIHAGNAPAIRSMRFA